MRNRAIRNVLYVSILSAMLLTNITTVAEPGMPEPAEDPEGFAVWQDSWRARLSGILGIPVEHVSLDPESRGEIVHDGMVIEKWIFTSEPGSRIPAVLYRPETPAERRMPAVVLTYGHGGSKSQPDYQYPARVFAKLGIACLAIDPLGEEERNITGGMGTRAHDPEPVHLRSQAVGRLIMGKLVWDTMRGLDFLLERDDIDPQRLGVSGNSLGGAVAGWMAVLDRRLRFAVVSGWAFTPVLETYGKFCTRVPNQLMRDSGLTWEEYLSLAAPHCALRIVNGDADIVIDKDGDGSAWRDTDRAVASAAKVYAALGKPGGIQTWYEPEGGHRPYPVRKPNLEWLIEEVSPAGWNVARVRALPEINFGEWCRNHDMKLERLYGTQLHLLGATVTDLDVVPLTREQLAVLQPEEVGNPQFTIEGWLDLIENRRANQLVPAVTEDAPMHTTKEVQVQDAWLEAQNWQRDREQPCISLGGEGTFDSMHVHAPCVYFEDGRYVMLYTGASEPVSGRVMKMGVAFSSDGRTFKKHSANPVLALEGRQVVTPTLLRNPDGSVLREDGKLRLWFTAFGIGGDERPVRLMETAGRDGLQWAPPRELDIEFAYAPSIMKDAGEYRMWFTDIREDPWCIRFARSSDGHEWRVHPEPVLGLSQEWEKKRLFYPTVLKDHGLYLMWYGSYSYGEGEEVKTALGFAVSPDGLQWEKNPHNPVFGPDASRSWESHYTTSQTVLPLPDGSWRIWYASRSRPPFVHKYFAIGTARWDGPYTRESPGTQPDTSAEADKPKQERTLRVAGIMGQPVREGNYKEVNFRETETLIREAAKAGAELVCTYEQFLDGYGFDANKITSMDDEKIDRYEVVGESPYLEKLGNLAREQNIVIVAGVGIREVTGTYNSALIFDRSGGLAGVYRKTHNQNRYARWFAPLSREEKKAHCPSFDVGTGRLSVKICNDRHFRETTEYMIQNGCELILSPSYGRYDPSRLKDDTEEFGIWAVFVHPRGCQFIEGGEIAYEQRAVEGKGTFALYEVEFRHPSTVGSAAQ